MGNGTRLVGLAVHEETIAVAVTGADGRVQSLGTICNTPEAVDALIRKLREKGGELRVRYEGGPGGCALRGQLTRLGVNCEVLAPSLVNT